MASIALTLVLMERCWQVLIVMAPSTYGMLTQGAHLRTLTRDASGGFSHVDFSPDGQTLASAGGFSGTINVWDVKTGAHREIAWHEKVYIVVFSPDGQTLAGDTTPDTINVWDVNTGDHLRSFTGDAQKISSVVFSPDGRTLASASYGWNRVTDNSILIVGCQHRQTYENHQNEGNREWGLGLCFERCIFRRMER